MLLIWLRPSSIALVENKSSLLFTRLYELSLVFTIFAVNGEYILHSLRNIKASFAYLARFYYICTAK